MSARPCAVCGAPESEGRRFTPMCAPCADDWQVSGECERAVRAGAWCVLSRAAADTALADFIRRRQAELRNAEVLSHPRLP